MQNVRLSGNMRLQGAAARRSRADDAVSRALVNFTFGPNPGALAAKMFVPAALSANAPLVVVLHGCTQTPEGYDRGTGWSYLAERHGFAILYPQQQRVNNPNGCFNWFETGDTRRGFGEPASIKSMIDQMAADHAIDPKRIFITGLSAGAAMAGVMLATYPEVFAGGGLIAGLPYGVAKSMPAAFSRMRSRGRESDAQLGELVRQASDHDGPWPTISVWHGTADVTVAVSNADATVAQWRDIHGLGDDSVLEHRRGEYLHRIWHDASGRACVEEHVIEGMDHGTPVDVASSMSDERAGAYLLDVGLSSTQCLASSWGLTDATDYQAFAAITAPTRVDPSISKLQKMPTVDIRRLNVQTIIEDALRSAGLMR